MESARPDGPASFERLGRYQLVTELEKSPLGALHAAYVSSGAEEGRIVAIRRVPVPARDRDAQQRVSRAGIGAMSVRHARLAAVLDVMPGPNSVAVVSEYVEAASLRVVMRQCVLQHAPLPATVAVAIVADVLRALRAARDLWRELSAAARDPLAGYVHGGLLPDSIMIASFGETMLADVGVAGAVARVPDLMVHPDALPYRAPEQLKGAIDERSDVYAAGVLLWEMLANRPLFGAPERLRRQGMPADAGELKSQITDRAIPRLDKLDRPGARLQPMLVEIVHEALARDPSQRFPTIDALLDALRTLARDAIASPEQVSVAIGRLVRGELEARRVAIELAVGFDRASAPPESARSTARPPPPEAMVRVAGPGTAFSITEAPTVRRRQTPQPNTVAAAVPAATAAPIAERIGSRAPALGRIAVGGALPIKAPPPPPTPSAPAMAATVPAEEAPESIEAASVREPAAAEAEPSRRETSGSGIRERARDSVEPSGLAVAPPSLSPLSAGSAPAMGSRRRTWFVVFGIAAVVALAVALMARTLGSPSAARQPAAPKRSVSESATDTAPRAEQAETDDPKSPTEPEPSEPEPDESEPARSKPEPRPDKTTEPRSAPAGKKPYRPRGI